MGTQHFYKFRSLTNLKRFLDIIIKEKLYSSRFDKLNDPMEGAYLVDARNRDIIELLKIRKFKTRICSFSSNYTNTLMWTHYADEHKGCCIEFTYSGKEEPKLINYKDNIPTARGTEEGRDLLSHKSKIWEYEGEYRVFSKCSFIKIKITKVIFGINVPQKDYSFYKDLIGRINSDIIVKQITKNELITGFNNY